MSDPCEPCGQCCVTMDRPPFLTVCPDHPDYERWRSLPSGLVAEIEDDRNNHRRPYESPRLWYDTRTRRCLHYDLRPEVCREYTPRRPVVQLAAGSTRPATTPGGAGR